MNELFFFVTCQSGMESVVKANISQIIPAAKFAFSKPGFITYKLEASEQTTSETLTTDLMENALGVRSWGFSTGQQKIQEPNWGEFAVSNDISFPPNEEASKRERKSSKKPANHLATFQLAKFLQIPDFFEKIDTSQTLTNDLVNHLKTQHQETDDFKPFDNFHIWFRDGLVPAGIFRSDKHDSQDLAGFDSFSRNLVEKLKTENILTQETESNSIAKKDSRVLDLCMISPTHWWTGWHTVESKPQRWSGGVMPIPTDQQSPVSRAYYKAREAFAWSGLVAKKGDRCAEIGSSPGGSCQWLLQRGLKVIGIDPAEMDPLVTNHPNFRHIRRRGLEVKRSDLAGIRWLLSDANIHPDLVLDTVEALLDHQAIDPEALILTIKPPKIGMLQNPEVFLNRIKSLGYQNLMTRQLVFNRQEFCVVARK